MHAGKRIEEQRTGPRLEIVGAGLLALFGLLFVFLIPPGQAPDEESHFLRAYDISHGNLWPAEKIDGWGGIRAPVGLFQLFAAHHGLLNDGNSRLDLAYLTQLAQATYGSLQRSVPSAASTYTFVPYIPQALAMAGARLLGAKPLGEFLACRLANLFLAVIGVYCVLRLLPMFKLVVAAVVLLPISVQQLASCSADASTIVAALLLTALLLRLALVPGAAERTGMVCLLAGATLWLPLCKFAYAPILLLYLAIPAARFGTRRRHACIGCALLLLCAAGTWTSLQMRHYVGKQAALGVDRLDSADRQQRLMRAHPDRFLAACARTVLVLGPEWADHLGKLGWLNAAMCPLALRAMLLMLILLALAERTPGIVISGRLKLAAVTASSLFLLMTLAALYLAWCAVGAKRIDGFQGRYLLPVLPLLLLPLYSDRVKLIVEPALLRGWTLTCALVWQAFGWSALAGRIYLTPGSAGWLDLVCAALGVALLVAVTWRASRISSAPQEGCTLAADGRPTRQRVA